MYAGTNDRSKGADRGKGAFASIDETYVGSTHESSSGTGSQNAALVAEIEEIDELTERSMQICAYIKELNCEQDAVMAKLKRRVDEVYGCMAKLKRARENIDDATARLRYQKEWRLARLNDRALL